MSAPQRAPRMSLGDMRSFVTLTAQFNPADLKRTVVVTYARLGVMGHSHEQLQFQFRPNEKLAFTLKFDGHSTERGDANVRDVESILDSMTLPSRAAQDISGGGPPDVLMLWPGILAIRCRITGIEYGYERLASTDGSVTFLTAKVQVEESRTSRLYAEDVFRDGLQRGGA